MTADHTATLSAAGREHDALQEELPLKQIHLIRNTYRLIGSKGMHQLSLQDVADSAGVSKAVIVYYFKTRENLVLKTMRWVLAQVADRIRDGVAGADTPEDKVRAMIAVIFSDALRNRNFYLAYTGLVDYAARVESFKELSITFRSIVNSLYADVIRSGLDGPFWIENEKEAATVVRAIIDGLFLQWLQEERWRELHEAYRDLCITGVLTYLGRTPDQVPGALAAPRS